jgi:hypothetical protein
MIARTDFGGRDEEACTAFLLVPQKEDDRISEKRFN